MNLKCELDSSNSDESLEISDYKMVSSKQQSTVKYSNSKSGSSDESLTDMIKKKRQQLNKHVYGNDDKIDKLELADATFDLSETYNDSNKLKNLNESTLESRIKKLEQELNTSLKSTQQRNIQNNQSASMTSVDSFSIDYKQFQQQDFKVSHYNNRLESIRSKKTEPAIEWKKGHKIEEFDYEISNLQQELQSLKDSIFKEEKEQQKQKIKLKQRLRQTTNSDSDEKEKDDEYICDLPLQKNPSLLKQNKTSSKKPSSHSEGKINQQEQHFKKKSKTEVEFLEQDQNSIDEKENKKHKKQVSILEDADESDDSSKEEIQNQVNKKTKTNGSKKEDDLKFIPISAIEFNQKDEVSIDVVPQKQASKISGRILQENQQPNTLLLPSKTSLQCDVSRLYKLNKEVEVLQQIEKIRNKLKKSINKKLNSEKVIEQYDPSFTMQSKSKILNKSGKQHCPNCTYLLNKGLSSALCHCNK